MSRIVAFALRQRIFIVLLFAFLIGLGVISFLRLSIEAYPDPLPPYVSVETVNPGQSATETERYVTIPLEIRLAGIPNVTSVQSISLFGLSTIFLQFNDNFTYDQARQYVLDRLERIGPMQNGAVPSISEDSPIGEIYRFRLEGPPGVSTTDLEELAQWVLKPRFKGIRGVVGMTIWGGKQKAYDVVLDQRRLVENGLGVPQVVSAIKRSDGDVGGQLAYFGAQAAVVRGVSLIHARAQIANTMVSPNHGAPVRVRDLGKVIAGHLPVLGISGQDRTKDVVVGVVLMRRGGDALRTVRRVEAAVGRINHSNLLPPGVHLVALYDMHHLIQRTLGTVLRNMLLGIVLIFAVQWLFLGDLRSALVVSATIPFALFFAVIVLVWRGEPANLLSIGAIDFGLIVDGTVIMVENVFRHLRQAAGTPTQVPEDALRRGGLRGTLATIYRASQEVNQPVFFSAAIILAAFVPLFTLSGVEGHIFGPMARTYGYAILGAMIATFTVSPALSALLLRSGIGKAETAIMRALHRIYRPVLAFALANRIVTLGGAALLSGAALLAANTLGLEFLPTLAEGNMWIRATMPVSVSLRAAEPFVDRMRQVMRSFPEVRTVVSQDGKPDGGASAIGAFVAEFYVPLKPQSDWPGGMTRRKLMQDLGAALRARFPGVSWSIDQYIQDNINEVLTGTKSQNAVKVYGHDLARLESVANRIKAVMARVPGITDLQVPRALGQPTVEIHVERRLAARYGLTPGTINETVAAAIGGQSAGRLYEHGSDRNFPIMVRLARRDRSNLAAIRQIMVTGTAPGGGTVEIPLADVATVRLVPGPPFIYRENQQRYLPVRFSVSGRASASVILQAKHLVARRVRLPPGMRVQWAGEFGELKSAIRQLEVAVPISLALIVLLLFMHFGSLSDTLIAGSVMPMAWIGGILALFLTGTPFSVSAAIGFIGLFGVTVMEGIIILSYFNALIDSGAERTAAILGACQVRLRPVLMTCLGASVGLLPAAVSTRIGSQVQQPLALVVVGGILLAPPLILVVLPVLIDLFSGRERLALEADPQPAPGE